jgi:hypothetical protein
MQKALGWGIAMFLALAGVLPLVAQSDVREQGGGTEIKESVPPMIRPGTAGSPPSDAVVLFDGSDLDEWEAVGGGPAGWTLRDGAMTVARGDIQTRRTFGDLQLHLEFRTPSEVVGESQGRGNSGVFLAGRYEVQVLDSYDNETYSNGQAGSLYKQHTPLVNASRRPGEWQTYDVVFMAPHFNAAGGVVHPATVTLFHNGTLVLNHVNIRGSTTHVGEPHYEPHGPAPIRLQEHGNLVSYRNIWVRPL